MESALSMERVFIKKLTDILEVNLENEHFKVKELAEALGVSRSQLHRKLHAISGKSTSQFIREFRLEKAMILLQNNVATASEIAYRVGFNSPTYFNTCFHEYYGYPPGEVKFRSPLNKEDRENMTTAEQANPDDHPLKKQESENISFNKRWVVLVSLFLVIIISIAYSFYIESRNDKINEPITPIENKAVQTSIAVLPIKNWSGDPELEYISDGMTDAVIARLTMIKSMTNVIPFTSVLKYKTSDKSVPDIAEELGVQNILQGNFQLSGDQMKITLQLINGPTNKHSWSHEYSGEWKSDEIFNIQSEVAENVAKNMNVVITDIDLDAIQKIPTNNKEAYALFLQATFQRDRTTKDSYKNAIPLYERAIALDSNFTEAYIKLAEVWYEAGLFSGVIDQKEAWEKTKTLSLKVLELDSTNIEIKDLLYQGYYCYDWNFELAEKYYQTRLNSSDLGRDLGMDVDYPLKTGRFSEALLAINNRISNMPQTIWSYPPKAGALFLLGKKEEAIDLLGTCDSLFTHHIYYLQESAKWYYYLEEYEKSKNQLKKFTTIFPDRPPIVLWLSAVNEHMDGNEEGIVKYLSELNKRYEDGTSGSPAWFISLYYCAIEDYENAIIWLQRSYVRHEVEMIWLREEPLLIPLRNDTRYLELYANVGFTMEPHSTVE